MVSAETKYSFNEEKKKIAIYSSYKSAICNVVYAYGEAV